MHTNVIQDAVQWASLDRWYQRTRGIGRSLLQCDKFLLGCLAIIFVFNVDTVNPLLSPSGGLFISSPFKGGLIETGALFNLETMMVSVLHIELEYKVEKLKYKKF